jgi:hypothetical protein
MLATGTPARGHPTDTCTGSGWLCAFFSAWDDSVYWHDVLTLWYTFLLLGLVVGFFLFSSFCSVASTAFSSKRLLVYGHDAPTFTFSRSQYRSFLQEKVA